MNPFQRSPQITKDHQSSSKIIKDRGKFPKITKDRQRSPKITKDRLRVPKIIAEDWQRSPKIQNYLVSCSTQPKHWNIKTHKINHVLQSQSFQNCPVLPIFHKYFLFRKPLILADTLGLGTFHTHPKNRSVLCQILGRQGVLFAFISSSMVEVNNMFSYINIVSLYLRSVISSSKVLIQKYIWLYFPLSFHIMS